MSSDFETLAQEPDSPLDELALALAAEFHRADRDGALETLDALGGELAEHATPGSPEREAEACRLVLGRRHGFAGDRERYDHPENSMLDRVLDRRRGLPILLSVVYVEAGRRAGMPLRGVGLPGHFVVGHFGTDPPILLDPFSGGLRAKGPAGDAGRQLLRPWRNHETVLRMLNNLTATFSARCDFTGAIRAAELRLALPVPDSSRPALELELQALRANLN